MDLVELAKSPYRVRIAEPEGETLLARVGRLRQALANELTGEALTAILLAHYIGVVDESDPEMDHAMKGRMIVGHFCAVDAEEVDIGEEGSSAAGATRASTAQRNSPLITPVLADDVTMRRETKSNAKRREDMERAKRERAHRTAKLDGGETPPHDPMPASNGTGNTEASDWKHSVYIRDQVKRLEQSGTSKDNEKHGKLLISIIHAGFSVNGARDANFELTDDDATAKLRELASAHAATQFAGRGAG